MNKTNINLLKDKALALEKLLTSTVNDDAFTKILRELAFETWSENKSSHDHCNNKLIVLSKSNVVVQKKTRSKDESKES